MLRSYCHPRMENGKHGEIMKKVTFILAVLLLTATVGCSKQEAGAQDDIASGQIVSDRFELVTNVAGSTLSLSVDTDLPDDTVVMVTVRRSYLEKGNSATYALDYFFEKGTVGTWKSIHSISIAGKVWDTVLAAEHERLSGTELDFELASVSDMITVRMVVPVNIQPERFGKRNENLVGKAVKTTGIRVVEGEIEIDYPL